MSYNTSREKLEKINNNSQANSDDISRLYLVDKNQRVSHSSKRTRQVRLLDDVKFMNDSTEYTLTRSLGKIPESFLPFTRVVFNYRLNSGDVIKQIDFQLFQFYVKYNINTDNVWYEYYFNRIVSEDPDTHDSYDLVVKYKALAQKIQTSEFGYSYRSIPVYVTMDLVFINPTNHFTYQTAG